MRWRYKIVFLGYQNVGKTTLTAQYVFNRIGRTYNPTIGIDFLTKKIFIEGKEFKLQIWDTAGQERFSSIAAGYARDSFLAIICFDISDPVWLRGVDYWLEQIFNENSNKVKILLVGNKKDLVKEEEIAAMQAKADLKIKQLTEKGYDATYISTSALTLEGIKDMEDFILKRVKESEENNQNEDDDTESDKIVLTKKRGCC